MQKIAVAGKGGSGKTTIAGTLARLVARAGHQVWAIDADSNPNLSLTLGLAPDEAAGLPVIPRSILAEDTDENGARRVKLGMPAAEVARQYGSKAPDGIVLLKMGSVDHAGAG